MVYVTHKTGFFGNLTKFKKWSKGNPGWCSYLLLELPFEELPLLVGEAPHLEFDKDL